MSFQSSKTVHNPRKPHRCDYCGSMIPQGASHYMQVGVWDGEFYTLRGHHDCRALWLEAFDVYGDWSEGMGADLFEVIEADESRDLVQAAYDSYRGRYPHVICRLELRWQRGDIKGREHYRAVWVDPDLSDYPEVYG